MRFIIGLLVLLLAGSAKSDGIYGELHEVLSPSYVTVRTEENLLLHVHLKGVIFNHSANTCHDVEDECKRLNDFFSGERLGIVVEGHNETSVFGDIMSGDKLFSLHAVKNGWYRHDSKYSTNLALILAEKHARCNYVGMWQSLRGRHEDAFACTEGAIIKRQY